MSLDMASVHVPKGGVMFCKHDAIAPLITAGGAVAVTAVMITVYYRERVYFVLKKHTKNSLFSKPV